MSIKQMGDGLAKFWPHITAVGTLIAFTAVAYARLQNVEAKQTNLEVRQQRIEWYLVKIGTKLGIDFGNP